VVDGDTAKPDKPVVDGDAVNQLSTPNQVAQAVQ
jgi:hypothetical protein